MPRYRHIADPVIAAAEKRPEREAWVWPDRTWTWAEVERDVRSLAEFLRAHGVERGHVVAVVLPACPLHALLVFAVTRIGAVYAPLRALQSEIAIAELCGRLKPRRLIVEETRAELLITALHESLPGFRPDGSSDGRFLTVDGDVWQGGEERGAMLHDPLPPAGEAEDIAVLRFTAGISAERSRLVPLRHEQLLAAVESAARAMRILPSERIFGTIPFSAPEGLLLQLLVTAQTQTTLIVQEQWEAGEALEWMRQSAATALVSTTRQVENLLRLFTIPGAEGADLAVPESLSAEADAPEAVSTESEEEMAMAEPFETHSDLPVATPSLTSEQDEQPVGVQSESVEWATGRRLRFAILSGDTLREAGRQVFERHFGILPGAVYGSAETAGLITLNPVHLDASAPESVGVPVAGTEVEIRGDDGAMLGPDQVGQIYVRAAQVFDGYAAEAEIPTGEPGAEAGVPAIAHLAGIDELGWHPTGDLGRIDIDGWLHLMGRIQDRIIRGGFPVYAQQVERVLETHPGVGECAIVAEPDPHAIERVVAFVVPASGRGEDATTTAEELVAHVRREMPRYMAPGRVEFIDSLPRDGYGRLLRRELRARLRMVKETAPPEDDAVPEI